VENKNEEIEGWSGFDPSRSPGALYPNEVASCSFLFSFVLSHSWTVTTNFYLIRLYRILPSCLLVADHENVSETNLLWWSPL